MMNHSQITLNQVHSLTLRPTPTRHTDSNHNHIHSHNQIMIV